jgi:hypothetical protein
MDSIRSACFPCFRTARVLALQSVASVGSWHAAFAGVGDRERS